MQRGDEGLTEEKKKNENDPEEQRIPDCCSHKTKERSMKEYKALMNRLNRIEGQVRGVKNMLEQNAYCTDIMTQVAAINSALNSFNKVLLENHMKTCMIKEIREGNEDALEELLPVLQKLMK
jgi:DNA-binding FrmR family transcriptional regulator